MVAMRLAVWPIAGGGVSGTRILKSGVISPQHVSPCVKTNKNDANDAVPSIGTVSRPTICFIAIKFAGHRDMRAIHRVRELLVHQCATLIYQVRRISANEA